MIDLSNKSITQVLITDVCLERSIRAFNWNNLKCKFTDSFILSSKCFEINKLDPKVQTYMVPPINSIREYSRFCIQELNQYIHTDYCLITQWDGIVINPNKWLDEFLAYDYVGAPWNDAVVGNGGLSLRSKYLLQTTQAHLDLFPETHPEDVQYGRNPNRSNKLGFKIAPYELAECFSIEAHSAKCGNKMPFGVHNRYVTEQFFQKIGAAKCITF